jgi:subtilisin family serine protease
MSEGFDRVAEGGGPTMRFDQTAQGGRQMKKLWWLSSAALGALGLMFSTAQANRTEEAVPGEIIVGLRDGFAAEPGVQARMRASLAQVLGADSVREIKTLQMDSSIEKIVLRDPTQTRAAISRVRNAFSSAVKYAEPNFVYHAFVLPTAGEPNDTDFSAKQWDMQNTGQLDKPGGQAGIAGSDIGVVPLWKEGVTGSRQILVAVIDTGIDYTHPDLAANMFKNTREIPANGIDDDGNGVVDDVYGANFSGATGVGNGMDDHNHGTHCAGTIGAVGNDGNGLAGVNWSASIMPSKFLDSSGGGSLEGAINAIKYATKMGAKVMSNSWGGGNYSDALKDAIAEAGNAGALFVAAAGNDANDNDAKPSYPASYDLPNVISVAATDNRDGIASFSNYGARTVHVAAPGVNIYSTVRHGGYDTYSGTSMATPHVSGIAALIWGANPSWTAAEVKRRLIETSTPVKALRRASISGGRVNAYNAFHGIIPPRDGPAESDWKTIAYTLESAHPYADASNLTYEVSAPGAKYIRVIFDRLETEARYDPLTFESPTGEVIETISGTKAGEYVTDFIASDKALIRLKSDSSVNGFGFKISKIQIVE